MQLNAFGHQEPFVLGELDKFEHANQVGFPFDELLSAVRFGSIKGATGARHSVSTTRPERIRAKAMVVACLLQGLFMAVAQRYILLVNAFMFDIKLIGAAFEEEQTEDKLLVI